MSWEKKRLSPTGSITETRRVHILVFLCLVATELIGKRQGERTAVSMLVYLEPLPPVVHTGVRGGTVEQVIVRQTKFGFLVGRSPFQSGIDFPDGGQIIIPLNGGADVQAVQLQADGRLGRQTEGIVHHRDSSPNAVIEADGMIVFANILEVGAIQREAGVPEAADRERQYHRKAEVLFVVVIHRLINHRQFVGALISQLGEQVFYMGIVQAEDVFAFQYIGQVGCIVRRGAQAGISHDLSIAVEVARSVLHAPIVGIGLV